jgi:hypothetical protein
MKNSCTQLLVLSVACALILSTTAGAKKPNPAPRPVWWTGTSTIVVDLSPLFASPPSNVLAWEIVSETGDMDHLGAYSSYGGGVMVVGFDENNNLFPISMTAKGWLMAANGDQVFWSEEQTMAGAALWFDGGTGRFLNATGKTTPQTVPISDHNIDWGTMTMTLTLAVSGSGWISY